MSNLTIQKILEAIHFIITQNGFTITEKQQEKADEQIVSYLIDNLDISEKDCAVKHLGHPEFSTDKRIYPAVMKYFSIIQDNVSLYNDLLEENYDFIESKIRFKFYSLDKNFTNHFKKNEFRKLLVKNDEAIRTFYNSLRGLDSKEKEEYYSEFEKIVHRDASVLRVGYDDRREFHSYNFITARNIEYFGSDFLINSNPNMRKFINSLHMRIDEESADYIKSLLEKYPDFVSKINIDKDVISNFNIDELYNMSYKDSKLYEVALKRHLVSRMKELLEIKPEFNPPENFIREEILELSNEAIDKISKIRFKEIDNVVVMPVKEINKIVMLDKAKKKISNITGRSK